MIRTLSKMDKDPVNRGYRLKLVGKNEWDKVKEAVKVNKSSEIAALSVFGYNRPIIMISEPYFEKSPGQRTPTLVHELSHQAAGTKDHAYDLGNGYTHGTTATTFVNGKATNASEKRSGPATQITIDLRKKLENADTVSRFVMLYK